jgi:hypothetical protein
LAALVAIGCNIGPQRMAAASGLNAHEISFVADWHLTEEALKSATIEIINFASRLPMSRIFGRGDTCSADGMRFYVPANILAADYSHVLAGRGVTLYAHTADNFLRMHQQPIPCRAPGSGLQSRWLAGARHRTRPEGLLHRYTTPLYRKHINPFGRYHFDVSRMRNVENTAEAASGGSRLDRVTTLYK